MARADVASASVRSDSIKGLAQSIARPTYRRLLNAEPLLRRAVPVLIVAFLATICVGAVVQILDHKRQTIGDMIATLDSAAEIAGERLITADTTRRPQDLLADVLPVWATASGRTFLLTNEDGFVTATAPAIDGIVGRRLIDILGPTQPLTTFGAGAGVLEIALPDGTQALATVRMLRGPLGQLAALQTRRSALMLWRSLTTLTVTLSATTGFVVLILGFAFHWQSTRAR
ncbi:MAG: PAS domain-containing sensor histidine kinase, partial [Pseudolabrys sp.]|nr:PAS domain-containing sensor histidine kinase [Pseudolabrys sp.]